VAGRCIYALVKLGILIWRVSRNSNPLFFTGALWLVVAASLIWHAAGDGLTLSTDDAMRLVQTRDLLNGQSWFDTTQWRMNVPQGLPMHWSHLVDAALAAMMLMFRPLVGAHRAEIYTLYFWPGLLLLPVLIAMDRLASHLAGRNGGLVALILTLTCIAGLEPFQPGSIDHHNIQIALMLWMGVFLIDFERRTWAPVAAASFACLSLAIGLETLPLVVVALVAVCAIWTVKGNLAAPALRRFGGTFALASAVLLGGATASVARFTSACDMFSGFYAALGITGGCALVAISFTPRVTATVFTRAAGIVVLAVALLALAAVLNPVCLRGPYGAVDPQLNAVWLSRIDEAQSPLYLLRAKPDYFMAGYCYALFATLAAIASVFVVRARAATLILAALAVTALAVSTFEVRAIPFALFLALPGLTALIVTGVERFRLSGAMATLALVIAVSLASDIIFAVIGEHLAKARPKDADAFRSDCLRPMDFRTMGALPKGRVLGFVDQGPYILALTPHAAVAGPYHRDSAGILDTYTTFTAPPAEGADILARRGIDYVAVCKTSPDYAYYLKQGRSDGLLSQLAAGRDVAWLERVPEKPGDAVILYRVRKDRLSVRP
jgi:hypothetical protein